MAPPMQQRSRLSRWLRRSVWLLLALIIAPIAAVALLVGRVWLGQPELDGERMVPGLGAEATISRDSLGVVHIKAATEQEAYFALGFAHAQDRFFQMEMLRRLAAGRLAEVVGPPAAGFDVRMRILGVDRMAEKDVANLPADIRAIYQRYADGVNAWLQTRHGVAADELTLALAPDPEPWTPAHSIAWTRLMSLRLVSIGEESRGLHHDVDIELAPGQVAGVALGVDRDGLPVHDDGALTSFNRDRESASHGVILEQVRERLGVGQVIDGDDGDVVRASKSSSKKASSDSTKAVDGNVDHGGCPFIIQRKWRRPGKPRPIPVSCSLRLAVKPPREHGPLRNVSQHSPT